MANLKTLKTRIKSVKSTQKMTKAMKMVAASRLKRAKHAVEVSRPYADKLHEMISTIASNVSVRDNFNEKFPLLTGKGKEQTHLIVIISSDRGLCGGLNSATVKFAKNRINFLVSDPFWVILSKPPIKLPLWPPAIGLPEKDSNLEILSAEITVDSSAITMG